MLPGFGNKGPMRRDACFATLDGFLIELTLGQIIENAARRLQELFFYPVFGIALAELVHLLSNQGVTGRCTKILQQLQAAAPWSETEKRSDIKRLIDLKNFKII